MDAEGAPGPATTTTAAAAVADKLARIILADLPPGESLPSENELASQFEVSRLTVREAVKMLAGRGLLDLGRGRRAIVREPSGALFSDFLLAVIQKDSKGLFDLIELRMSLEVQAATLAARRATRAGIAAIEAELNAMMAQGEVLADRVGFDANSEGVFHAHDAAFHEAIALSSGNRLISYLFEAMSEPLQQSFRLSSRGHALRGSPYSDVIEAHRAVLVAVADGNPKSAAAAMRRHLEDTERDIKLALNAGTR